MEVFSKLTHICNCPNCGVRLHYRIFRDNIYSGGPWYCGRCGKNVTEAIYGPEKLLTTPESDGT